MSLNTTETDIVAVKTRIKAYGATIQRQLTANATKITASPTPTTKSVTLSNDIKDIQTKLDKMKLFVKTAKEVVWKEGTDIIAQIKTNGETIFNNQRSALQLLLDTIETTVTTKLNQHKKNLKETVDEIKKVKVEHLTSIETKRQSMDWSHKKTYDKFKKWKEQFK